MPRRALHLVGGWAVHVLNRSTTRMQLFSQPADYRAFEAVLAEGLTRTPTRLLAYCVMPNHWHLVMWPQRDELPPFMHWVTMTHAKRWREIRRSVGNGHVYQDRYRAIPVQTDIHLARVIRYVERNPLRSNLVGRAEEWRWSSLWRRCNFRDDLPLAEWPFAEPANWLESVNAPHNQTELDALRRAVGKERPFGDPEWVAATSAVAGRPVRDRGRPPKRHLV